jgi:DNA-binding response OmpR family regulator
VRKGQAGHVGDQGLRAFHLARPEPFDLVVLDIGLPAMDGWAVLERIRDLSDVPVLDPLGVGPDRVKFGVMRLRRKLGQGIEEPGAAIEAVRGFGYRYVPPA